MMKEPSYNSSRRYLWLNAVASWLLLFVLGLGAVFGSHEAVSFAEVAILPLTGLIVGNLGVHRGFGTLDYWAQARSGNPAKPTEPETGSL
ncbi:NAD(P)+ transhydrogenase beta chain [Brucella anthropi]|uniref:NAD(P)+ transhydrogenase beta chain n=1 Tax=Brucella anthropi TaxID=529 RepID=UPI002361C05D|nr:NAD(P)+ transhydrogenase beta chain [Brucella anthropi]